MKLFRNEYASVAGMFFFVMILIGCGIFMVFGGFIVDKAIIIQNGFSASGMYITQDAKDSMQQATIIWKYGVPIAVVFISGLWVIITALRERSGYV